MSSSPLSGSPSTYIRRVAKDINEWVNLESAYQTYKPLRVLAEGDSWLAYPEILGTKNITYQLADNHENRVIILCLAHSGDEAVTMMFEKLQSGT